MPRHWTPYEDRRLRELAPFCTARQIADRLPDRPVGGVKARAAKLGICIGPRSELETTLEWQMDKARLPKPRIDYQFDPESKRELDFAWPEFKLAVEVQGGTWRKGAHVRGGGYERDREKINNAQLMGWVVLEVTGAMVKDGRALAVVERAFEVKGRKE